VDRSDSEPNLLVTKYRIMGFAPLSR
jgi:hypothetical protein